MVEIAMCALYLFLTWLYGWFRYREGVRAGVVDGIEALFGLFQKRKVVDQDMGGNIFRVDDRGFRGKTIIESNKNEQK